MNIKYSNCALSIQLNSLQLIDKLGKTSTPDDPGNDDLPPPTDDSGDNNLPYPYL